MSPTALILTPDFPPALGGIQVVMHRVAAEGRDFRYVVVAPDHPDAGGFDTHQPFEVRRTWAPRREPRLRLPPFIVGGYRIARQLRPDVILSGHVWSAPAARFAARRLDVPYVQYLYADEVPAHPRIARAAVRGASRVIAISRHTADLAHRAGAEPTKVAMIPPGIDPPQVAGGGREPGATILTVARLTDRYKGHDVVMAAMPRVIEAVPEARWVIVGDGPLRAELEALAHCHGVADQVTFTGAVTDAERNAWFERSHVFVMPSRLPPSGGGEGFGIVYVEAGSYSLPVVAGNVAGALDAVRHRETGLLVDPESASEVAQALIDLLVNRDLASNLGRRGSDFAAEFAWPTIAGRVEDVMRAALHGGPRVGEAA